MRLLTTLSAIALAATAAACGGATAPRYHPEVVNSANSFAFQVTDLSAVSDVVEYRWQNDGTQATVNQSAAPTTGTVTLTIYDASGAQVYTRSLADNGTFTSTAGTPGLWRIRVVFTNASGAVNFRVQRTT